MLRPRFFGQSALAAAVTCNREGSDPLPNAGEGSSAQDQPKPPQAAKPARPPSLEAIADVIGSVSGHRVIAGVDK